MAYNFGDFLLRIWNGTQIFLIRLITELVPYHIR